MRMILNAEWDTPRVNMLASLQWLSVEQRIKFNTLKFIYKMEIGELPKYMTEKLVKKREIVETGLRRRSNFILPNYKKNATQNSLFYNGVKMYNEFKTEMDKSSNFHEFKKKATTFVKKYYSIS